MPASLSARATASSVTRATCRERYGRKGVQSREQVSAINAVDPPVIQKMRDILLPAKERADRGELTVLKPWLSARGA